MKFISLASLFFGTLIIAQKSDCTTLKNEFENQKTEIYELTKQNNYYKETLDLLKPLSKVFANNLELSIINAVGIKLDKTVSISYLYKNTTSEVRRYFQPMKSYFVDPRANQSQTFDVFANSNRARVDDIQPNVPMKGILKFRVEEIDFPMIKHLNLTFAYVGKEIGKNEVSVNFQNIPITWK